MIRALTAELIKLKRSLVVYFAVGVPVFVAVTHYLTNLNGRRMFGQVFELDWKQFTSSTMMTWAFFMLPLSVTVLCVLISQIEHGPKAWNYVLALPLRRWRLYLAKILVVISLTATMSALLWVLLPLSGLIRDHFRTPMAGAYDWAGTFKTLGMMYLTSFLQTAMLLWIALRFKSFVPPLAVGIGGAFVSLAVFIHDMQQYKQAGISAYFPWLIPMGVLQDTPTTHQASLLGIYGGLAVFGMMLVDLCRREVR